MVVQYTNNKTVTTAATNTEILPANRQRKAIYITVTSGAAHTLAKGSAAAVAGQGIVLQPNATWFETDGEGFNCWKGAIQMISSGAGSVAVSETTEVQ